MNKMVVGVQIPHLRLSQNTNPSKRRKVIRRPSVSQNQASYVKTGKLSGTGTKASKLRIKAPKFIIFLRQNDVRYVKVW